MTELTRRPVGGRAARWVISPRRPPPNVVGEGRHTAMVHGDWEIWGPCGGYVAAIALRAAGAESPLVAARQLLLPLPLGRRVRDRSTSWSRRCAPGAPSWRQRVEMSQEGRPVLDAMVWSVGEVAGLEHDDTSPPEVPGSRRAADTRADLWPDDEGAGDYAFWDNFDQQMIEWSETWPPPGPLPPTWRTWVRYRPTPAFDDPWVDAARSLVVLDVGSWPAGLAPAHVSRAAVHRTEPRPVRVVPVSRRLVGVAAARCAFAGGACGPALVDGPGLVERAPAAGQRRRPGGVPPHLTGLRRTMQRGCYSAE